MTRVSLHLTFPSRYDEQSASCIIMPRALRVWEIIMVPRAFAASLFSRVSKVRKHRDGCYRAISIQNPLSFRPSSRARSRKGATKETPRAIRIAGAYVPIERTIYLMQQITKCFLNRAESWIASMKRHFSPRFHIVYLMRNTWDILFISGIICVAKAH